ncbi:UDP-N-acetylglucosamine 2-epimerase [Halalkalibaculum sp. DA384]|uniref:UDP-N-acetylglucosamine 2-epimerase n=1 Tax=Halalkalibaculum sp. DA384 TaxID=3373606 RepID=UPI003754381A
MNNRKIAVITGTRAEFGLLYWVIKEIQKDSDLELQLYVTGMHLSPEFGLTIEDIEQQDIPVTKKIETLLSSDTPVGISKSMGLGMISFSEAFAELQPDLVLVLGDRFEIFSAVSAAMIARIPVAHCHGGEATEGLIDEPIRHSITKMSHLHFTSTEEYKKRVIQLGEQPDRVFNVGALGIENIYRLDLLDRSEFEESINFELGSPTFLVTYHPVTLEKKTAESQINTLLRAIDEFPEAKVIFTMPNADTDGRVIIKRINDYVQKNSDRCVAFTSLGQRRYLSALKHVDVVIGNSSSGLVEVPSFKKPTVDIGDRQRGRVAGPTVIHTKTNIEDIGKGIQKALKNDFITSTREQLNPYDNGFSSEKMIPILKEVELNNIIKKQFYDI